MTQTSLTIPVELILYGETEKLGEESYFLLKDVVATIPIFKLAFDVKFFASIDLKAPRRPPDWVLTALEHDLHLFTEKYPWSWMEYRFELSEEAKDLFFSFAPYQYSFNFSHLRATVRRKIREKKGAFKMSFLAEFPLQINLWFTFSNLAKAWMRGEKLPDPTDPSFQNKLKTTLFGIFKEVFSEVVEDSLQEEIERTLRAYSEETGSTSSGKGEIEVSVSFGSPDEIPVSVTGRLGSTVSYALTFSPPLRLPSDVPTKPAKEFLALLSFFLSFYRYTGEENDRWISPFGQATTGNYSVFLLLAHIAANDWKLLGDAVKVHVTLSQSELTS